MTVHPVKQPDNLYSLHHFYQVMEFRKIQEKLKAMKDTVTDMCTKLPRKLNPPLQAVKACTVELCSQDQSVDSFQSLDFTYKSSLPRLFNPKNRYELMLWRHFNATFEEDAMDISPQHGIYDNLRSEITHLVFLLESYFNRNTNDSLELRPVEVVEGYVRFNYELGREYMLDVKFAQVDNSVNTVRKWVRLVRPLGQEILFLPERLKPTTTVNVIVAVNLVNDAFVEFMTAYERASLAIGENTHLIVSVLDKADTLRGVQTIIANHTRKYPSCRVTVLSGKATRKGLEELGLSVLDKKDLVFLGDVSLKVQPGFFSACRRNTVMGERVYFPVPFAVYGKQVEISRWSGQWFYSSQMACIYKLDYVLLGSSDVSLFQRATVKNLEVMQAPDPRLILSLPHWLCKTIEDTVKQRACVQAASVDQLQMYIDELGRLEHGALRFRDHYEAL